ncbi:outer membrane protein [Pantanalinema sp. GBBB05]|uniref:outer membrane protein n=1 Tax=Pantanalinema sp. GBBB05 TaxID=2604139 RepID=UPI001DD76468|nr:hypothetical protein [Pantanalinema sp. GBBB05]
MVLIPPAAIAQEGQTLTKLQNITQASTSTDIAVQQVNDTKSNSTTLNLETNVFTTTASDLTLIELTIPTSNSTSETVPNDVKASKLEQLTLPSISKSENQPFSNFTLSSPITALEPQSTISLPTWLLEQDSPQFNLPSSELAQVHPAASGVSGPPIPSYPATTGSPSDREPPTESPDTPESTTTANKWHFLFQPYIYLPLSIYGDATVKGFSTDFAAGASTIFSAARNTFEFGFLGRLEGWTPDYHWGFLLNGDYVELGEQNSFTRPNPNRFLDLAINRIADRIEARVDSVLRQQIADYLKGKLDGRIQAQIEARLGAKLAKIIPSSFESDVQVQAWNVDIAGAYRFYNSSQVNPKGVATEFDLGPYLIDLMAGIRLAGVSGDLDVSTNLGGEGDFSRSVTTVKPLLGTRFRYNLSPRLAAVLAGSIAGFDIGNLGLNWEIMGGLDWMFSGNTSVGLGYRFAYMKYKSGSGSDAFEVSASNNGPYLTFTFRF